MLTLNSPASTAPPQVSVVLVRAVLDVAQRRGVTSSILLGSETDRAWEPADQRLPLDEFHALLARAISLTAEPALGLQCGLIASESSFGLIGPLVSYAATLRNAVELVTQFHALLFEGMRLQLSEQLGVARLECKLQVAVRPSVAELIVGGLVRMLRAFGCAAQEIKAVRFQHTRPAHHHAYSVAFVGAERFAQPFTGVEFATQALDRPHLHRQPELQRLIHAQAEISLQRLSHPMTCTEQVRMLLRSRCDAPTPDMACAARELGLSLRTLRRKLDAEGTSYRALAQSQLFEAACTLLRDRERTLQAVAHTVGFADSSTFHRAFKRWSGQSPAQYRAAALSPAIQKGAASEYTQLSMGSAERGSRVRRGQQQLQRASSGRR